MKIEHRFIDSDPKEFEDGILYISMRFRIVMHLCCCGCKNKVVTPLSPARWKITFDGKTISIYPSIGNWNFDCKSHYWITNSEVVWAEKWSNARIMDAKREAQKRRLNYYSQENEIEGADYQSPKHGNSVVCKILKWTKKFMRD